MIAAESDFGEFDAGVAEVAIVHGLAWKVKIQLSQG